VGHSIGPRYILSAGPSQPPRDHPIYLNWTATRLSVNSNICICIHNIIILNYIRLTLSGSSPDCLHTTSAWAHVGFDLYVKLSDNALWYSDTTTYTLFKNGSYTLICSTDKLQSFLIFLSILLAVLQLLIAHTKFPHHVISISQNVLHCSRRYCRVCKHDVREEEKILLKQIVSVESVLVYEHEWWQTGVSHFEHSL